MSQIIICTSGYTFYLGLIFDGYDEYVDTTDFQLGVILELPVFEMWGKITSLKSGDILGIQVRDVLILFSIPICPHVICKCNIIV